MKGRVRVGRGVWSGLGDRCIFLEYQYFVRRGVTLVVILLTFDVIVIFSYLELRWTAFFGFLFCCDEALTTLCAVMMADETLCSVCQ